MVEKICKKEKLEVTEYTFSRRQIREYTKWSDWQIRTHIKELEEMEYLRSHTGSWGKEYVYVLGYSGDLNRKVYLGLTPISVLKEKLRGQK